MSSSAEWMSFCTTVHTQCSALLAPETQGRGGVENKFVAFCACQAPTGTASSKCGWEREREGERAKLSHLLNSLFTFGIYSNPGYGVTLWQRESVRARACLQH